jgi:hypothetical protein
VVRRNLAEYRIAALVIVNDENRSHTHLLALEGHRGAGYKHGRQ